MVILNTDGGMVENQVSQIIRKVFIMFWLETRKIDDGYIFSGYNLDIQVMVSILHMKIPLWISHEHHN